MRHAHYLLGSVFALVLGCGNEDTGAALDEEANLKEDSLIEEECLGVKAEQAEDPAFVDNLEVTCGKDFHLYASTVETEAPEAGETLRVANFNVYHLGDSQGRFKNYDVMAEIINQWDVISAVELMTPNGASAKINADYRKAVAEGVEPVDVKPIVPGYIQVLKKLRERDESWSLVMTPIPLREPGDNASELAGFYFRQSRVELIKTPLCKDVACISAIKDLQAANDLGDKYPDVARLPFAAGFKAGNYDFSAVANHTRFRAPPSGAAPFPGDRPSAFRLLETQQIANWIGYKIKSSSADKDVMWLGDFNLEYTKMDTVDAVTASGAPKKEVTYAERWSEVLEGFKGAEVGVTREETSLSTEGLVSNYDHIILSPSRTAECDMGSAKAFDFTDLEAFEYYAEALSPDAIDEYAATLMEEIRSCRKFSGAARKEVSCELPAKLTEIKKSMDKIVKQVKSESFAAHIPLVSDHLPVSIDCEIPAEDDD